MSIAINGATLRHILSLQAATTLPDETQCLTVSTDSRTITPGACFVALTGKHFDGHNFVADAHKAGAVCAVVERPQPSPLPQLVVRDSLLALWQLAAYWRRASNARVTAITGSNGKTTTTQMLAAICRQVGATQVTRGNDNNEYGVPQTLLGLRDDHRFGIVEVGAAKPGDIEVLAPVIAPDVACVTGVAPAHLHGFGSIESVAAEKGKLYGVLREDNVAVLNNDEPYSKYFTKCARSRKICYSRYSDSADVYAKNIRYIPDDGGATQFRLRIGSAELSVVVPILGEHIVYCAMAAAACATAMGIANDAIVAGLAAAVVPSGRGTVHRLDGVVVVDDSYNANPISMRTAMRTLGRRPQPRILVLGDMAELGSQTESAHRMLATYVGDIDATVFCLGEAMTELARAWRKSQHFETMEALIAAVIAAIDASPQPPQLLVKGSRQMRMERVVQALVDHFGPEQATTDTVG